MPLFPYEKLIHDTLMNPDGTYNFKRIFIVKATGLGLTEYFLRHLAWLCLKDDKLSGTHICLVTGPRIDLAIDLIQRMKGLFSRGEGKDLVTFDTKESMLLLNNVIIRAYPSHHLSAMRGLPNVSAIMIDEGDFLPPGQLEEVRDVAERYIGKSDPLIIFVSTPNSPEGLFFRIQSEPDETCIYRRLYLDYTYGLGNIYTNEEISEAKKSPSFLREYGLAYLGKVGNILSNNTIDLAVEKGKLYDPDNFNPSISFVSTSMGIDPAFGSSKFAITATQWTNDHIQVLYSDEFYRPDFNHMLDVVYDLMSRYDIASCYIDGANPAFIKSLKLRIGEEADYEKAIARYKEQGIEDWDQHMRVIPVHFNKEHREMLGHVKTLMEYEGDGRVAIHPKFDKLLTALRTATERDGSLVKEDTSYDDLFDSFRLALKFYSFKQGISLLQWQ